MIPAFLGHYPLDSVATIGRINGLPAAAVCHSIHIPPVEPPGPNNRRITDVIVTGYATGNTVQRVIRHTVGIGHAMACRTSILAMFVVVNSERWAMVSLNSHVGTWYALPDLSIESVRALKDLGLPYRFLPWGCGHLNGVWKDITVRPEES
ncbi:hypothetical protein FB566_0880 [Stackebrandtia endophytica]|uniref:Uncharacterized protein n=1 Tax=Stackebrandtia endophytica TaxID=1496996 RepID=A0A543AS18_9ACTN|nr:hypothetical protein FB566_0880 [Stackebrandtia endophytica]